MPIMVDAELWRESGRIDAYGKELVRFDDRHGREFVLGPTHEETVTALVRNELRSYKQLPVNLYHIQDKFRDEFRPRFGLMRGREFIMKDAYSFSATQESLQEEYDKMKQAYANICERCYIKALPVVADSGEIGGDTSVEYMALADAGEASLVYCDDCGFAADDEAASTKVVVTEVLATVRLPRSRLRAWAPLRPSPSSSVSPRTVRESRWRSSMPRASRSWPLSRAIMSSMTARPSMSLARVIA